MHNRSLIAANTTARSGNRDGTPLQQKAIHCVGFPTKVLLYIIELVACNYVSCSKATVHILRGYQ